MTENLVEKSEPNRPETKTRITRLPAAGRKCVIRLPGGRGAVHQCDMNLLTAWSTALARGPRVHRCRAVTSPTTASDPGRKTRVRLAAVASSSAVCLRGLKLMTETFRHAYGCRTASNLPWNTHASTVCRCLRILRTCLFGLSGIEARSVRC